MIRMQNRRIHIALCIALVLAGTILITGQLNPISPILSFIISPFASETIVTEQSDIIWHEPEITVQHAPLHESGDRPPHNAMPPESSHATMEQP